MTSTNPGDEFEANGLSQHAASAANDDEIENGNDSTGARNRTRTKKGLLMDLEKAKRKRDKAAGIVKGRIRSVDTLLKESEDIVKLTAGKDGLEMELETLRSLQEEVTNILLEIADEELQSEDADYFAVILNNSLECLADVKMRLKDKEQDRFELLSRKSDRSSTAKPSVSRSSSTSSKRAAARASAAALRAKMDSLKRLQYIDRKQDELSQQQRELARLGEQEKLQGELSAAEAIQKILQEPDRPDEMKVTSLPADSRPLFYRNANLVPRKEPGNEVVGILARKTILTP